MGIESGYLKVAEGKILEVLNALLESISASQLEGFTISPKCKRECEEERCLSIIGEYVPDGRRIILYLGCLDEYEERTVEETILHELIHHLQYTGHDFPYMNFAERPECAEMLLGVPYYWRTHEIEAYERVGELRSLLSGRCGDLKERMDVIHEVLSETLNLLRGVDLELPETREGVRVAVLGNLPTPVVACVAREYVVEKQAGRLPRVNVVTVEPMSPEESTATLLLDPEKDELYMKGRKERYSVKEVAEIRDLTRELREITEDDLIRILKTFPRLPLSKPECDKIGNIVRLTWSKGDLTMLFRVRIEAGGVPNLCGKVKDAIRARVKELMELIDREIEHLEI